MGKCKCCCTPGPRGPPGNAQDVIWRPFYTGPQQKNLVRTPGADGWNEVVRLLSNSVGPRVLYLDPTDATSALTPSPFVVPPGNYDLSNVTVTLDTQWSPIVSFSGFSVILVVEDGATFTNFLSLSGPFTVEYRGTSTPAMRIDISTLNTNVHMVHGASVSSSGSQAFWQFFDSTGSSSQKGTIVLDTGSFLLFNTNAVVDNLDVTVDIIMVNYCVLSNSALSGSASGDYNILFNTPFAINNVPLGLPIPFDKTTDQSGVAGTISLFDTSMRAKTISQSVGPAFGDDNMAGFKIGDIWVNTTTDFVYVATSVSTGAAVWILVS